MMKRRHFLAASSAALLAAPSWASAGAPAFIAAGNQPDNSTWIVGLGLDGSVRFAHSVPGRGHAAALHPERAEAIAIARRPGDFALVLDCATGAERARLRSPEGRHFYGHGAFTADGRYLLTTENAYDVPEGRLGVWDAENGYARVDDLPSGGIGPHEMLSLSGGGFVVANGGIQTHPDYARRKLNLPRMRPNLTYLSETGEITEQVSPPETMRQNSIRHLAEANGLVAIALQWQGPPMKPVPLVATHRRGEDMQFLEHPETARLKQYAGSISLTRDGREIAVTGPKGSHVLFFSAEGRALPGQPLETAAGAAPAPGGVAITVAGGLRIGDSKATRFVPVNGNWSWDNHLVAIG